MKYMIQNENEFKIIIHKQMSLIYLLLWRLHMQI